MIREQLISFVHNSRVCRALGRATERLGAFCSQSSIWRWFVSAPPHRETRGDRLARRFVGSRFCEFVRSSAMLGWLCRIPELPWILMMLTGTGALFLPTIAVMMFSLLTLFFTLVGLIFGKERLPQLGGGVGMWLLFTLITLVYTFVSFGGFRGILSGGIRLCMMPLLPCALTLLSSQRRVDNTLFVFHIGVLCVGGYGLYQYFAGAMSSLWTDTELFSENFGRLTSTFENPNVYGTFLLLALPITLVSALTTAGWKRWLYCSGAAVALINLVLTYSRGCYVSMVIILFILLICYGRHWLWVGVGALAAMPFVLPESVLQRVMSIGNLADTSVSYRISIWKGAWELITKYWWMGVGIGDAAFESVYAHTALAGIDAPHAHNLLLQIVCESGVLGAAVMVGMFVCLIRTAMSAAAAEEGRVRWLRITLIACWVGLLVQGFTDYIFYNNNLFAIMMISLGAMIARPKEEKSNGC